MAQKWTDGKRCTVAIAALLLLSSCTGHHYGFSQKGADGLVTVAHGVETITLQIELDDGYAAAEEFTQRVSLRTSDQEQQIEQADFATPFAFNLEPSFAAGTLELVIGFCNVQTKEICFVANETLELVASSGEAPPQETTRELLLRYRPEPPRL